MKEKKYPRQDKIIELLHERHITQRELAERLGMKPENLTSRLDGRVRIKPYLACKIAKELNVPMEDIVAWRSDEDKPVVKKKVPRHPYQSKLIDILRGRGITNEELGWRIGVSASTISVKLGGYCKITVGEAIRIARVIGMPVEEIFIVEGETK